MKKIYLIIGILFLSGIMIILSCKKDNPEETPVDKTPGLTFKTGTEYVSSDVTIETNTIFTVGVLGSKNPNTNIDLATFKVTRDSNDIIETVHLIDDIAKPNFSWESNFHSRDVPGEEKWRFSILDYTGQEKVISFVITTTVPIDLTPTLTFIDSPNYISGNITLPTDSMFQVGINASANSVSNSSIETFKVVRTFNSVSTTVFDADNISSANYTWEDDLMTLTVVGEEWWTFTVVDKDGLMKELSFIITTIYTGPPTVVAYSSMNMGSYNEPTFGNFMASATGTVMTRVEATADQASIDFAFYLGATNKSTFGAPSNDDVQEVFDLFGLWVVYNETLFEMANISTADFDAIGETYTFPEFTGTEDDVNNLETNDVVYFKTVNDKLGFIKVNSINRKGDFINIDMKVMK